ncbi:TraB/GumN family protein [Lacinutrix sp. Hel_I_90]|uniref:TraB/GumN family protein n=1 Tax=Lacinutrix sp. Hel_I_90 TaxID=1249999 RepID=UPI0005CA4CB3|nr:TraB/GumN family protein [Lacinutrix sp. Hel_I_90]
MQKLFLFIITFSCLFGHAQEQEQSLLWEISGNGLTKSSYIYGTMHVSKKVAFRLDDVFFEALAKSESIALESDPSTWLEHSYNNAVVSPQNIANTYDKGFYSALFNFDHPEELMVRSAIRQDNRMINGYLYRKNSQADNFEEETYLDMFIYQAGKKKNKPIISLEDLNEAEYLTTMASANTYKKKIDPWLTEIYEKESPYILQENTYRDRNLSLLDSIGEASNTDFFREHMLYKRNDNMVTVLDTLIQKQSVFAGVGAAHLPGEQGLLNALRKKGYTVNALTSKQTQKGQEAKQNIEDFIAVPEMKRHTTADGFLSLKSFTELREFYYNGQKFIVSPDMTNGAYLTINRFNLYEYLPSEQEITLERLENFLFEDIPGDIISKEQLSSPFPGLSVLNKTKKGDYQKYHIYKTPLEVIIIKFGGPKNYVLDYEKAIFNAIEFKTTTDSITPFSSPNGKYSVAFPRFNTQDNMLNAGNKFIQGVAGDAYYFLSEAVNQDTYYIEEDAFEAKYIISNFYKQLKIETGLSGAFNNGLYKSYESQAKFDGTATKNIHLKSIVKDGSYYLLGYVGDDKAKAETYFKSFKFNTINYSDFETTVDTSLHFSVLTNTKPMFSSHYGYDQKKKKHYAAESKETSYYSKANEQIFVTRMKFHDLQMYKSIDSLWEEIDPSKLPNDTEGEFESLKVTNKKKTKENNTYTFSYTLTDSFSSKAIRVKHIQQKGVLFTIKSLSDSVAKPSTFVTHFYDTFKPIDTLMGESIFKDKTARFFTALKADDSIVMNTYNLIKFNKTHTNKIIDLIENFEFPENKQNIKINLIRELITIDDDARVLPFLKQLYTNSYSDPKIQATILKALLNKKEAAVYEDFLFLLRKDLPLEKYGIRSLFYTQNDSLALKKELFPELLEYSSIQEYKAPIYNLLAMLMDSSQIKPKNYKSFKKTIINDGKIEIKRSLSETSYRAKSSSLYTYVKLIFPFRNENYAQPFFEKLLDSDNADALATYYVLLEKADEAIPKKLREKTLDYYKNQALLVNKLYKQNLKKPYLAKVISQKMYAKSYLFSSVTVEKGRDSISFLTTKPFETDAGKKGSMYFFMLHQNNDYDASKKLYYAAFLEPEKSGELVTSVFYKSGYSGNYISETDKEDELIAEALEGIKYKTRKRVNDKY